MFLSVSLALSCLDVVIKDYYLSLCPRLRVLVPPCCVHRDRRPDQKSKRRPLTSFCFVCFWKSFVLVPVCLSRGKEVATRPSALAHVKSAWEFGGIAASPLAASPHARRSREISAPGCGYPKPASWLPSSRVAAPPSRSREITPPSAAHPARRSREIDATVRDSPSPPFAGDHAAGPPLTQARRPTTDSSPVDPVHMFRPGVPCLSCCAHRNILMNLVLSCPWRLVEGRRLL